MTAMNQHGAVKHPDRDVKGRLVLLGFRLVAMACLLASCAGRQDAGGTPALPVNATSCAIRFAAVISKIKPPMAEITTAAASVTSQETVVLKMNARQTVPNKAINGVESP